MLCINLLLTLAYVPPQHPIDNYIKLLCNVCTMQIMLNYAMPKSNILVHKLQLVAATLQDEAISTRATMHAVLLFKM